jgi:hypothetical protein
MAPPFASPEDSPSWHDGSQPAEAQAMMTRVHYNQFIDAAFQSS